MTRSETELEEALRSSMRRTFGGVHASPGLAERAMQDARRRRRRTTFGAAASAAACVAAAAMVAYTVDAGRQSTDVSGPTPTATAIGFDVPPLHPGQLVHVAGRVVINGSGAVLCPASVSAGGAEDTFPCRFPQLALTGARASLLSQEVHEGAQVSGLARFTGVWTPGHLAVRSQAAADVLPAGGNPTTLATSTSAPCPSPAGGWATGPLDWSAESRFVAAHPGLVVGDSTAYPASGREILVLAVSDVPMVSHALSSQYPGKLCIVRSKFTREQVAAARDAIQALAAKGNELLDNGFEGFGPGVLGLDGQVHYTIFPAQPDSALKALAQAVPPGLVTANYWITPGPGPAVP